MGSEAGKKGKHDVYVRKDVVVSNTPEYCCQSIVGKASGILEGVLFNELVHQSSNLSFWDRWQCRIMSVSRRRSSYVLVHRTRRRLLSNLGKENPTQDIVIFP